VLSPGSVKLPAPVLRIPLRSGAASAAIARGGPGDCDCAVSAVWPHSTPQPGPLPTRDFQLHPELSWTRCIKARGQQGEGLDPPVSLEIPCRADANLLEITMHWIAVALTVEREVWRRR
jgi:hypothetical protein